MSTLVNESLEIETTGMDLLDKAVAEHATEPSLEDSTAELSELNTEVNSNESEQNLDAVSETVEIEDLAAEETLESEVITDTANVADVIELNSKDLADIKARVTNESEEEATKSVLERVEDTDAVENTEENDTAALSESETNEADEISVSEEKTDEADEISASEKDSDASVDALSNNNTELAEDTAAVENTEENDAIALSESEAGEISVSEEKTEETNEISASEEDSDLSVDALSENNTEIEENNETETLKTEVSQENSEKDSEDDIAETIEALSEDATDPEKSAESNETESVDTLEAESSQEETDGEAIASETEEENKPSRSRALLLTSLLSTTKPISIKELKKVLKISEKAILTAITDLKTTLYEQDLGLMMEEVAGGYRVIIQPALYADLAELISPPPLPQLSSAALETLAIISYKQPITRGELEAARGTGCSSTLDTLQERDLIKIVGQKDVVGKPLLYGTTERFLLEFGLKSLEDLPPLDEKPTEFLRS